MIARLEAAIVVARKMNLVAHTLKYVGMLGRLHGLEDPDARRDPTG